MNLKELSPLGSLILLSLLLMLISECSTGKSEISYPPDNIYNFDELVPLVREYVDGYDRRIFRFTISWNVYFQGRGYRILWVCSDGTLHFTRPIETYSEFEDHSGYYPAFIRIDSVGVTSNIRVVATPSNFSVEFHGVDMRFSQNYKFKWILTYRKSQPKEPEVFDVDIRQNSMRKSKGLVRSDQMTREIDISKKRLARYTSIKLHMRSQTALVIGLGIAVPFLALITFVGILCCIVSCLCCRPCLRCCMDCCCICFAEWLSAQSGWSADDGSRIRARSLPIHSSPSIANEIAIVQENRPQQTERSLTTLPAVQCLTCRTEGANIATACQHTFHERCLSIMYENLTFCPQCKSPKLSHTARCLSCGKFDVVIPEGQPLSSAEQVCSACRSSGNSKKEPSSGN